MHKIKQTVLCILKDGVRMSKLKVIELFAGVGAQRQALKEAGINHEVVAISEVWL